MDVHLDQPIGLLMRPTFTVDLEDSLELAARKLRDNGCGVLPITENGVMAGAISEGLMARALADGMQPVDSVKRIAQGTLTAHPATTGAEALRLFESNGAGALVVLDDAGRVLGIVTPSDLYPKRPIPPRPPLVGGMATPFGVYLTSGTIRAGVGHFALMTTGAVLFGLYLASTIATIFLMDYLAKIGLTSQVRMIVESGLPFLLFLGGMRLLPLSGIHAAEHKVVHAIERGEDLVPSTVKRMPRVHPRCGTNLAVGATIFMSLGNANLNLIPEIRLLIAAAATLAFWRPIGNLIQYYVTTKPPSDKQIAMGIRSGRELLASYAISGGPYPTFWRRIYNSGMLHVIAGSLVALGLAEAVLWAFHIPLEL